MVIELFSGFLRILIVAENMREMEVTTFLLKYFIPTFFTVFVSTSVSVNNILDFKMTPLSEGSQMVLFLFVSIKWTNFGRKGI